MREAKSASLRASRRLEIVEPGIDGPSRSRYLEFEP